MNKLFTLSFIAVSALMVSGTAKARDFLAYQTTTPMLYRYAACALATDKGSAEEQIESCRELRQMLEQDADKVLLLFSTKDRRPAQLNMQRGFAEIDKDAKRARDQRKTVPASIIAYLNCMGESVMQTEDYRLGIAVDYITIEDTCSNDHILSVTHVASEQEIERIQILYRRFARFGRYVDKVSGLGAGIASTKSGASIRLPGESLSKSRAAPRFVVMDQSFLNLSQLPADEKPQ